MWISTNDHSETDEGLDKKLSLHYYSRMRFLANLLPQLTKAGTPTEESASTKPDARHNLSRVVSVLEAGGEAPLVLDDLSLKTQYSLRNAAKHAITMTSLSMQELAASHPATSFIHAYPGAVKTGITREFGPVARVAINAMMALAKPLMVPLSESGERHLYAATSPRFPPRGLSGAAGAASGADGTAGSGAYLLHWDGSTVGNQKVLQEFRKNETGKLVWTHTTGVFESICGKGDS